MMLFCGGRKKDKFLCVQTHGVQPGGSKLSFQVKCGLVCSVLGKGAPSMQARLV